MVLYNLASLKFRFWSKSDLENYSNYEKDCWDHFCALYAKAMNFNDNF